MPYTLAMGLLWEGFEWVIGIIGSPRDTAVDLAMDVLGGLLAAAFCIVVGRAVLSATGAIAPPTLTVRHRRQPAPRSSSSSTARLRRARGVHASCA